MQSLRVCCPAPPVRSLAALELPPWQALRYRQPEKTPAMQQPSASTTEATPAAYAPPNPSEEAKRQLLEARDQLTLALDALHTGNDPARASELVGRASNRIGSALHYLRTALHR